MSDEHQRTQTEIVGPMAAETADVAMQRHQGRLPEKAPHHHSRRSNGYIFGAGPQYPGGASRIVHHEDGSTTSEAPFEAEHARPVRWAEGEMIDVETGQVVGNDAA